MRGNYIWIKEFKNEHKFIKIKTTNYLPCPSCLYHKFYGKNYIFKIDDKVKKKKKIYGEMDRNELHIPNCVIARARVCTGTQCMCMETKWRKKKL